MSLPLPPDPYKALGVDPKADAATIKTAYKKLVLKCHPDKFPDEKLKAIKQDEFQRVQQAYEILGDDDKRQDYDLDVKAKRLREELLKQRSTSSSNGTPRKFAHVNIRTAEPTAKAAYAAAPQPPPPSKGSYSPYSGGAPFAHSWEQTAGRHSRTNSDDQRPHRARSYEKDERESRESRRRRDDEERVRIEKEMARDRRRKERAAEAEAASKEEERRARRERRRQQEEEMMVQQEKERAKKRTDRERADKKEKQDRLRRRESEDKRTKSRSYEPFLEDFGDEEEEIRRSSARKSSSKKRSNEPIREKSTGRGTDRDQPLYESPKATTPLAGKLKEDLDIDIARGYMASMRRNSSKASPLTTQYASDVYPDPDVAWHPPAHVTGTSRRHSGEGRHSKGEPVVFNAEPEPMSSSSSSKLDSRPSITPLKKASTFAESKTGGRSTSSARMPMPMPGHLQRAQTMQPEFIGRSSDPVPSSSDRHPYKSSRQRKFSGNIDVVELPDDLDIEEFINKSANTNANASHNKASTKLPTRPRMPTSHSYSIRTDDDGVPRTSSKSTSSALRREESAYGGGGGGGYEASNNPFPKVKTAAAPQQVFRSQSYAPEDVYYASYDSHGNGVHGGRSYKIPVR